MADNKKVAQEEEVKAEASVKKEEVKKEEVKKQPEEKKVEVKKEEPKKEEPKKEDVKAEKTEPPAKEEPKKEEVKKEEPKKPEDMTGKLVYVQNFKLWQKADIYSTIPMIYTGNVKVISNITPEIVRVEYMLQGFGLVSGFARAADMK